MSETIGTVIRKLRKERNFTQEELAEQLGVTAQAVSKWENETGMPDISQVVPLATVFGVSTDVLFGRAGVNDEEDIKERLAVIFRYYDAVPDGEELASGPVILDMYRDLLKDYPNHPTILLNAAAFGSMYIEYCREFWEEGVKEIVGQKVLDDLVQECIHWDELVIKYAADQNDVLSAKRDLMQTYARLKRFEEAYRMAESLPRDITETRDIRMAELKWEAGETEEQRKLHHWNIDHLLKALKHQVYMLGNLHMNAEEYEDALYCYDFIRNMMQALYRSESYRPPFHDDGYPLYHFPAFCLLQLGKTEEALDLLEESMDFFLAQAKDYNKKLSVENPLLRENVYSYGFEGTAEFRLDRLKKGVRNPCFSTLADHPRYTALVERVNALIAE